MREREITELSDGEWDVKYDKNMDDRHECLMARGAKANRQNKQNRQDRRLIVERRAVMCLIEIEKRKKKKKKSDQCSQGVVPFSHPIVLRYPHNGT